MKDIIDYISKVSAAWVAAGLLVAATGFDNIGKVDLTEVLKPETLDGLKTVLGAVMIYIGDLKSRIIIPSDEATISRLSNEGISLGKKAAFLLKPHRFSL